MNPHMLPKVRSDKLTNACEGMPCTLRIASFLGQPCAGQDTVVGCHLPIPGKGISTKVTDLAMAAGCHTCHAILDGSQHSYLMKSHGATYVMRLWFAQNETQAHWVAAGLLTASNMRVIQ